MKTTKFKTNIKCSACVEKVTPHLNEEVGAANWEVDLTSPQRILTISEEVSEAKIKEALQKAGYNADLI
jgi:copper chaperone